MDNKHEISFISEHTTQVDGQMKESNISDKN